MDELTLAHRITLCQPANLSFANRMHGLVAFDGSPGSFHRPESEARDDSFLDESVVLLDDKAIDVDTYTDVNFTLDVTFISPTGIVGGGTWGFDALLNGTITKQGDGSLNLDFNPGSKDFTFQNASSGGFFTFSVANLGDMRWNQFSGDGSHQGDYELVGSISGAVDPPVAPTGAVPEPGSVWLAATAICGTAIGLRRKVRS
jgi:hypothetical protein